MPATLSDNFNDNSLDTSLWDVNAIANQNVSVTVVETGGQQVITPLASTAGTNRNGLTSDNSFNMTQGFVIFRLDQKAGANASVETRCGVYVDASNYISFEVANTTLTFRKRDAASNSDTTTTYNSTNHKWLMLMRCGTHWFWYTSADQVTWTQQRASVTSTFAVTAMKVFLDAGTTGSVATITPTTAIFDDVSAGTIDFPLPFEQLAAFGGKVDLVIDPGFPLNIDIEGVQGEPFTIPMAKQRVGARITTTETVVSYKATCTGEIDTLDIWLNTANPSVTSAIFNLEINGTPVFAALGRPIFATGVSHVQLTDVGAAVVIGDDIRIVVDQCPSEGISGIIDTLTRVVVS